MVDMIYLEHAVRNHPVAQRVRERFSRATVVPIERYGEVFNRKAQNFRLQKKRPALILAHKFDRHTLPAPPGYGIGHDTNYYVSHLLNCVYDCRYCFLQGMYRSAHYVLFVNYDDFKTAMRTVLQQTPPDKTTCFFTGYDCDSLALEPVSGYVEDLLTFAECEPTAGLELRTKSTQIRTLLNRPALAQVIVAFSFTPQATATALEHKVPSVSRRIEAMRKLAAHGWPLGLRFDPLIYSQDFRPRYKQLFADIFSVIKAEHLHSVSFGPFRLPQNFYRTMQKLYPDEPLFAGGMTVRNGISSYPAELEHEIRAFCETELRRYLPAEIIFPCEF